MGLDGQLKANKLEDLANGETPAADQAPDDSKASKKNARDQMPLKALKALPKEQIIKEVSLLRKELRTVSDEVLKHRQAASALPDDGPFLDPLIWAGLCGMGFDLVAGWLGNHWTLTKEEGLSLGAVLDPVAKKHIPDVLGNNQEECAAAVVFVQIVMAKISAAPKKEVKEVERETKPSGDGNGAKGQREE